jgi:hypothetical protein
MNDRFKVMRSGALARRPCFGPVGVFGWGKGGEGINHADSSFQTGSKLAGDQVLEPMARVTRSRRVLCV